MDLQTCPLVKHERILVPLDGSLNSDQALVQAINLAKACNSKLYLLHVAYTHPEYFSAQQPALEEKADSAARALLDRARQRAEDANIQYEKIFEHGEQPHEQIVQKARDNKIDLIIMGTHGRSGLKRMLMGSVTAKVIGHAPCAVMVIPQAAA